MGKIAFCLVATLFLQGCAFGVGVQFDPLRELRQSLGVRTNLPVGRNSVVVTCPLANTITQCEVRKFDQWTPSVGKLVATLTPGTAQAVPFSGFFGDQRMTLQVSAKDDKDVVMGMKARVFYANDSGNSGDMQTWEITRGELEQGGR
jgi:hypothetical protein